MKNIIAVYALLVLLLGGCILPTGAEARTAEAGLQKPVVSVLIFHCKGKAFRSTEAEAKSFMGDLSLYNDAKDQITPKSNWTIFTLQWGWSDGSVEDVTWRNSATYLKRGDPNSQAGDLFKLGDEANRIKHIYHNKCHALR